MDMAAVQLPEKVRAIIHRIALEENKSEEEILAQAVKAYSMDKWEKIRKESKIFEEGLRRELSKPRS